MRDETVEEFLARGGKIKKVPMGVSNYNMSNFPNAFRRGFKLQPTKTVIDKRTDVRRDGAIYQDGAGNNIMEN